MEGSFPLRFPSFLPSLSRFDRIRDIFGLLCIRRSGKIVSISDLRDSYVVDDEFGDEVGGFPFKNLQYFLYDMVAVLVHDDLQGIDFYNFGDFILHFMIFVRIFHDFLNDPASVAVQTHKKKLFLCHFVDELLLPFAPHL
jgi:hypothetical protein